MATLDEPGKAPSGLASRRGALAVAALIVLGLLPFLSILSSGNVVFASDQIGAPAWKFLFEALRHFEFPLWNPYALAGMPTVDASFGDGAYPPFLLLGLFVPATHLVTLSFILHVFIAGVTAYILLRRFFGLERLAALALAAAYMLNTNFISHIHAGHTGKFYIMAWLPLSLFFLLRSLGRKTRWYHLLGLALTISLFISTSHLQFTYYVLMGYFLLWAFHAYAWIRAKQYRALLAGAGKFWLPILLGIGLAFPIFYPPIQYNKEFSVRGQGEKQTFEHAASWSLHPEEAASLIVPEFTGLNEHYWGRNPFKLNSEYPGLAVVFLAVFGLAAFRRKWLWFWASVGLLSIIFALGADTPFFRLFYTFVPGMKNFRAPSMMLFWLVNALLMMSAQTLLILFNEVPALKPEQRAKLAKKLLLIGFGAVGVLLLCAVATSAAFGVWNAFIDASSISNFSRQAANASSFGQGALWSALMLAALVAGVWKFGVQSSRPGAFSILLLAVVCIDLYWRNSNFLMGYEPDRFFPHEAAVDFLQGQKEPLRVFGLPGAYERSYLQYWKIEAVDGFVDNENRIYAGFRGNEPQPNSNFLLHLNQNPDGTVSGNAFLDMLNVKFLAYRLPNEPGLHLAENRSVLPRAWFVDRWETRPDSLMLDAMKDASFDPRKSAFVSTETPVQGIEPRADTTAKDSASLPVITREGGSYNRTAYKVRNAGSGLLILSEIYFPHWKVEVDGKPAPLLRVDYGLQGLALVPGNHTIDLRYRSPWINKSLLVSGLSLLVLVAGLAGFSLSGGAARRKK